MAINFDDRPKPEASEVEQVELFTLEGKTYTIPSKVDANRVLAFMQEMRNGGQDAAAVGLLIDLIGRPGYLALRNYPGLQMTDLKAIFDTVSKAAMGSMEELTGN